MNFMDIDWPVTGNAAGCRKRAAFPLTPALSLGEREKFCRATDDPINLNFIQLL